MGDLQQGFFHYVIKLGENSEFPTVDNDSPLFSGIPPENFSISTKLFRDLVLWLICYALSWISPPLSFFSNQVSVVWQYLLMLSAPD